ncbi:MAG: hypothetical protein HON78_04775 [Legionellales bacterium]|nr:hypothetical protein [Legionellales bacterium]
MPKLDEKIKEIKGLEVLKITNEELNDFRLMFEMDLNNELKAGQGMYKTNAGVALYLASMDNLKDDYMARGPVLSAHQTVGERIGHYVEQGKIGDFEFKVDSDFLKVFAIMDKLVKSEVDMISHCVDDDKSKTILELVKLDPKVADIVYKNDQFGSLLNSLDLGKLDHISSDIGPEYSPGVIKLSESQQFLGNKLGLNALKGAPVELSKVAAIESIGEKTGRSLYKLMKEVGGLSEGKIQKLLVEKDGAINKDVKKVFEELSNIKSESKGRFGLLGGGEGDKAISSRSIIKKSIDIDVSPQSGPPKQ